MSTPHPSEPDKPFHSRLPEELQEMVVDNIYHDNLEARGLSAEQWSQGGPRVSNTDIRQQLAEILDCCSTCGSTIPHACTGILHGGFGKALALISQTVSSVIGEDDAIRPRANPDWSYLDNRIDARNKLRAEQRTTAQRLLGGTK